MPVKKKPKRIGKPKTTTKIPYSENDLERREYIAHQWGIAIDSAIPALERVIESQVFLNTRATDREAEFIAKKLSPYFWSLVLSALEKEASRVFKR